MSRLEDIARRRDRHLIPRHCWDERDWREQRRDAVRSQRYQSGGIGLEIPVIPQRGIPAGFGGLYGPDDRERRTREVDRLLAGIRRR